MLELFKAIGLGLVVILPLANPLTTVALFLGLAGEMNFQERNRQALQASIYVFLIMMSPGMPVTRCCTRLASRFPACAWRAG